MLSFILLITVLLLYFRIVLFHQLVTFFNIFSFSFLTSLLTAVLSYHLAWVPTVTPAGASPSHTYLDKHTAKWVCDIGSIV